MPYASDRRHNPRHEVTALKRIPAPSHAPIAPLYSEPSLRFGLIVPLTLVRHRSRCRHHVRHLPSVSIAPTPPGLPLSPLLRDTLVGITRMQNASPTDKYTSTPVTISDSETNTQPSLYVVSQGRYAPLSKSGQTRYGNINECTLDCVKFSSVSEKDGGRITVAQILQNFTETGLDGANEPVLQHHGTNITLHILVGHFQHFLRFAHAHRCVHSGLIMHHGPPWFAPKVGIHRLLSLEEN